VRPRVIEKPRNKKGRSGKTWSVTQSYIFIMVAEIT